MILSRITSMPYKETVKLEHVLKGANKMANVLANLVATLALGVEENINVPICEQWVVTLSNNDSKKDVKVVSACVADKEDWHQLLINYLKHGKLPSDVRSKTEIQQ